MDLLIAPHDDRRSTHEPEHVQWFWEHVDQEERLVQKSEQDVYHQSLHEISLDIAPRNTDTDQGGGRTMQEDEQESEEEDGNDFQHMDVADIEDEHIDRRESQCRRD